MNEQELANKLSALEAKIDAVYVSAEKTRKYFLTTIIITVLAFVVPLIGLAFVIPQFLSSYTSSLQDMNF
jgi:hypothetical protein